MPLPFDRDSFTATHPTRPVPWLPWIASAVFIIGLAAAMITLIVAFSVEDDQEIRVQVVDSESSVAIANADVTVNGTVLHTDDDGYVAIDELDEPLTLEFAEDGYHTQAGTIDDPEHADDFRVQLRPVTDGELALTDTSAIDLSARAAESTSQSEAGTNGPTDLTGGNLSNATDAFEQSGTPASAVARNQVATPTPARPQVYAGTVSNRSGEAVQGAIITDGTQTEVTGADGLFSFDLASTSADSIRVFAPGYAELHIPVSEATAPAALTLERQDIKAIYFNPNISDTQEDVDRLINLINTTEVNAMVIDIKEELIFYDSDVEFFENAGTVSPTFDLAGLLKRLEENNIYTIARLVVFKDSIVAEKYPDLAVKNSVTGDVWRDMNGVAWVNPMLHALWDANTALAVEAANLGFDEIQYDYVRFPTDGDLSTMEFGLPYTEENRVRAISKFLEQSKQALIPTGAKLSADVFGFTMLVPDDLGIGQDATELAPHVDYLSPMVYPSHFPNGSMALDGHPNDYPYETIEISMRTGREQLGSALQLRPWLQDFDFFDMMPYGREEVRAQIRACEDVGTSGWMLWDPNNQYTDGALGPDEGNLSAWQPPAGYLAQANQPHTGGRTRERTTA